MFTFDIILIFQLIILIFSVMIHEIAHGSVAYSLGDPTAKNEGRLTLNPLKHIDVFGSIILPLLLLVSSFVLGGGGIIFGWAKPVPINPYNFTLGIFNLLPIPPLDGSHILFSILQVRSQKVVMFFQQYGLLILIFVLFSGGFYFLNNIIGWFFYLVTGVNLF